MTDSKNAKTEIASYVSVPQRRVVCNCGAIYTGTKLDIECGCGKKMPTTNSGCVLKIVTGTWVYPDGKTRRRKSIAKKSAGEPATSEGS